MRILSTNGTGRATGHGTIVGAWAGGDIVIVEKPNGKCLGINRVLLRKMEA